MIITDAAVSDAGRILRLADEESRRDDRRRISVLCIDAAPNLHLAMELAERGGGVAKFLTSDPEQEDISTALDEALADWAEPVFTELRLEVNSPVAQAAGREVRAAREPGWSGIDLGDLPAGRAVWVMGRAPRSRLDDFEFKLTQKGLEPVADCRVEIHRIDKDHKAIKSLFGARRVLGLEYLINSSYASSELNDQLTRLGYDPGQALASKPQIYAENARTEAGEALRNLLVREALDYGLACSETAFVAVRKEAGRVIDGSVAVANALPAGWSDDFIAAGGISPIAMACFAPLSKKAAKRAYRPSRERILRQRDVGSPDEPNFASQALSPDMFAMDSIVYSAPLDFQIEDEDELPDPDRTVLFSGRPQGSGEIILFDSSRDQSEGQVREAGTINRLIITFAGSPPAVESFGAELCLLVFVGDLATARAKVKLADLVRQGGARPLNLSRKPGDALRLALVDPAGVWSKGAPHIEVALEWA